MSALPEDKRRDAMLRELELLPVWRQRESALAIAPSSAVAQNQALAHSTPEAASQQDNAALEPIAAVAAPVAELAAELAATPAAAFASETAVIKSSDFKPSVLEPSVLESGDHDQPLAANSSASTISAPSSAETEHAQAEISKPEISKPEIADAEEVKYQVTQSEITPANFAVAELLEPEPAYAAPIVSNATVQSAVVGTAPDVHSDADVSYADVSDADAAEREYFAAIPSHEYAPSVEPDWYSQEELAAAPPDRRAQIMGMEWQALQESVSGCQACQLHSTRTQTVFGVGDPQAQWLFVGEAPGSEEDKRGEPFVGQAGKLLDNMLAAIQLKRGEDVYIANVLKCRPPANRDPQGEEVQQCDPYLKRQVELIKPKLIVALGKFAAQSLLQSESSIATLRGDLHDFHGVPVIVTYHPAYLLRNLTDKARAWEDLCFARATMRDLQSQQATPS